MATNFIELELNESIYFSEMETMIETCFDNLILKLMRRKDKLIDDLRIFREEYTLNQKSEVVDIAKMRKSQVEMTALLEKLETESAKETMLVSLAELNGNIEALENTLTKKLKEIYFSFETEDFDLCLPRLGNISKKKSVEHSGRIYADISEPIVRFGKPGKKNGLFSSPRGICADRDQERLFIADGKNARIQIWTIGGEYLLDFGKKHLKQPWGVCIGDNCLFVSDSELNTVFKFNLEDFKLVSRTSSKRGIKPGQMSSPAGMAVDEEVLYVTEHGNNRISVFSIDLAFMCIFGKGLLTHPMCVKLTGESILISEMDGLIKTFTKEGRLVKVLKRSHLFSNYVSHFCIDKNGNLLVCDRKRNSLLILTQEGKLILSINTSKWGCESPFAVEIAADEKIVCSLQGGPYSLIVF